MTTDPAVKPDIDAVESPLRDTPVLLNRKLHPDRIRQRLPYSVTTDGS